MPLVSARSLSTEQAAGLWVLCLLTSALCRERCVWLGTWLEITPPSCHCFWGNGSRTVVPWRGSLWMINPAGLASELPASAHSLPSAQDLSYLGGCAAAQPLSAQTRAAQGPWHKQDSFGRDRGQVRQWHGVCVISLPLAAWSGRDRCQRARKMPLETVRACSPGLQRGGCGPEGS